MTGRGDREAPTRAYTVGRLVSGGALWAVRCGDIVVCTALTEIGAVRLAEQLEQADDALRRALAAGAPADGRGGDGDHA